MVCFPVRTDWKRKYIVFFRLQIFYNTYDQGNAGVLGIYEYFNNRLWKGWHGLQRPLIYLTDNHLPGGAIGQADPMEMYNYNIFR